MKTINKLLLLLLLTFIAISCEDIFEEDISNDNIETISPKNNTVIESNVVNFQWNELDGAKKYRVQVLNLDETVVIDSLVTKNNFICPLSPGNYKWKVRGENFAYESKYSTALDFSIITTNDLTNQQVILSTPDNNIYKNDANITLKWQKLGAATGYNVEVLNVTTGESVYSSENKPETTVQLSTSNLAKDAAYQWKVRGVNITSQTLVFSSRNFNIDTVVPGTPQNSLPATNAIISSNQSTAFSWISPTDTGTIQSPLLYTIEFSNTNTFTTILTSVNNASTTYQYTFTTAGDYYWRIKTTDAAGNISAYSTPFKLTVI
ncbi:hypothetical protein [Flavobacterium sp. 3-210]